MVAAMTTLILIVSLILQFSAAIVAMRLFPGSGRRKAWLCLAVALFLMGLRRLITLFEVLVHDATANVLAESVALVISIFMLTGLVTVGKATRNLVHTEGFLSEELSKSEALFRAVFNQTFQYIGIMQPDGVLIDANSTSLKAVGINREEIVGEYFWDTVWWRHSKELQQQLRQAVAQAAQGEFVRFEATHLAADGSPIHVDFSLNPVKDDKGNVLFLIPEGRDITDRKTAEQQLKESRRRLQQAHDTLEEQVRRRTLELENANTRLQELAHISRLNTLGELVAGIAHELNQPLSAISNYATACEFALKNEDRDSAKLIDNLQQIAASAIRAGDIIRRLRGFSSKANKTRKTVDLNQVVLDAVRLLDVQIRDKRIKLNLDLADDLEVTTLDEVQIQQVVVNLLQNAFDALQDSDDKQVTIRTSACADQPLQVSVVDSGSGIQLENPHGVFRRVCYDEGYGHGNGPRHVPFDCGKPWRPNLVSQRSRTEGNGVPFFCSPKHPARETVMAVSHTVCIVDDDSQSRNSVVTLLTVAGFNVQAFSSAETFLENCLADTLHGCECLVLDVRLPGMSGLELQEKLKSEGMEVPIVLVSGHASEEVKAQGKSNGAKTLLEKPFGGHQLVEEVTRALASRED